MSTAGASRGGDAAESGARDCEARGVIAEVAGARL